MTQEQEIKGILVHFFREGTNGDYLNALNSAINDIQQVKNCSIPNVVGRYSQQDIEEAYDKGREDGYDCMLTNI